MDYRREYGERPLNRDQLHASPFEQLLLWIHEAAQAGDSEPNAMTLATVSSESKPSSRTVLAKSIEEGRVTFFTSYLSRKAHELAGNPAVSATFFWRPLERQVSLEGTVERLSLQESEEYWRRRTRGSQLGAWASHQGKVIPSRRVLEDALEAQKKRFNTGDIPLPAFWGGFQILPTRFEFWQGRRDRLHDRFQYRLETGAWIIERLSP